MRLGAYLSERTRPELEELENELNLTDDEREVFFHLSKGRSKVRIADECSVSIGTVSNRISAITRKVERLIE